jgi:hypothetical protein
LSLDKGLYSIARVHITTDNLNILAHLKSQQ